MDWASFFRYREWLLARDGKVVAPRDTYCFNIQWPRRQAVHVRTGTSDYDTWHEIFQSEIYSIVLRHVPECDYIIDLGANIGLTSIYFAGQFPKCQVSAVEPDPSNFQLLEKNLSGLVESRLVRVINGAVWHSDTRLTFARRAGAVGHNAIRVAEADTNTHAAAVTAFSIPTLLQCAGYPRADIVKIDIEGAEEGLFKHDPSWLERVNAITIEFHEDSRSTSHFDQVVRDFGFIVEEDRFPNTAIAYRTAANWVR